MRRVTVPCAFCNGEGRFEEFICPCCLGEGYTEKTVCDAPRRERPEHERIFNTTPEYALRKERKQRVRHEHNQVVLGLLGLVD